MNKLALAALGIAIIVAVAAFPKFLHELAEYVPLRQGTDTTTQSGGLQLKNGERAWMGIFRDSSVKGGEKSYASQELGISLRYPIGYILFERAGEGGEPPTLIIAPEKEALESIERAREGIGSEGPPTINLAFYPKDAALEEWLRTNPSANFMRPTMPPEENALAPMTIAGRPAFSYENDGLYWNQYVAFEHGAWIVVASSALLDRAAPNPDFQTILASIELY